MVPSISVSAPDGVPCLEATCDFRNMLLVLTGCGVANDAHQGNIPPDVFTRHSNAGTISRSNNSLGVAILIEDGYPELV